MAKNRKIIRKTTRKIRILVRSGRRRQNPKRKIQKVMIKGVKSKKKVIKKMKSTSIKKVKSTPTKITELNEHCLFEIFKRLDIKDLVSVSAASKSFTDSARSVFKYKYANEVITVTNLNKEKKKSPLSTTLLNHFGKLIKKLKVKYYDEYHRFDPDLEKAIVKHCRYTVTEIEFINFDQFAFLNINQPFRMAKKVVFSRCTLCKFIFEFNKWFPCAQSLDFVESKILHENDAMKCLKQKFTMLAHLGIVNPRRADEGFDYKYSRNSEIDSLIFEEIFTGKNVRAAIHLNPQLTSLKLKHNNDDFRNEYDSEDCGIKITSDFLVYVNRKLRYLEKLDLTVHQYHLNEGNFKKSQMHFKNLKQISIAFKDSVTLYHYPISSTSVTELTLIGNNLTDNYEPLIRDNDQCEKLVLFGKWESVSYINDPSQPFVKAIETIKLLSNLKSFHLHYNGLIDKGNVIVSLLNECKSLSNLTVGYKDESNGKYKNIVDDSSDDEENQNYDSENDENSDEDEEYLEDMSKQKNLIKLKEALKHLSKWEAKVKSDSEQSDNDSSDFVYEEDGEDDETDSDNENAQMEQPKKMNGEYFEEMFRSAFEANCLGTSWQQNYTKCGNVFWATYEKH